MQFLKILKQAITIIISVYLTLLFYMNSIFENVWQGCLIFFYWYCVMLLLCGYCMKVKIRKNGWVCIGLFICAITTFCCIRDSLTLKFLQDNTVQVVSYGEKDERAQSNELCIKEIRADGVNISLDEAKKSENWYYKENSWMCYPQGTKQDFLSVEIGKVNTIQIVFVQHPWSGKAKILLNEQQFDINMYAEEATDYVFEMTGNEYNTKGLSVFSAISASLLFCVVYIGIFRLFFEEKVSKLVNTTKGKK